MYVIELNYTNPKPMKKYLGEMNSCNNPRKKAKLFTKEEADKVVLYPVLQFLNPKAVPA